MTRVLGRIGVGAIIGCVVAIFSGVTVFVLATGPVPGQFGLEAGLLLMALVVIAVIGGLIVGGVASGLASAFFFKDNPSKALWASAAAGLLIIPVGFYFASLYSASTLSPSYQNYRTLGGHTDSVHVVAFSPDGKYLASAGTDRTVIIRETDNLRRIVNKLTGHEAMITDLAFSTDSQTLVSADFDGVIHVWDMNNLDEPTNIFYSSDGLGDVEISPNGKYLVAASFRQPDNLVVWPLDSEGHNQVSIEKLSNIAFDPEGSRIAATTYEGDTVRFYTIPDLSQQEETLCCMTLDNGGLLKEIAFEPDGNTFATVVADDVYLWPSLEPGSEPTTLHPETEGNIMSLALSPDGRYLAVGRTGIFIWDLLNLDVPPITLEDTGYVFTLSFDATGRYLAAGGPHPQVSIYDLNELK